MVRTVSCSNGDASSLFLRSLQATGDALDIVRCLLLSLRQCWSRLGGPKHNTHSVHPQADDKHQQAGVYMHLQSSPSLVVTGVSNDPHGYVHVPRTNSRAVLPTSGSQTSRRRCLQTRMDRPKHNTHNKRSCVPSIACLMTEFTHDFELP
jgi:hypothetical protein